MRVMSSRIGRLMPARVDPLAMWNYLLAGRDAKSLFHSATSDRHHPAVLVCRRLVPALDPERLFEQVAVPPINRVV